jgi:formylglycine-generating enzyme required for sulfatase activity
LIKAGSFMMGSPTTEADRSDDELQHRVTLTKDYYLGTTEVTQGQWQALMGMKPWQGKQYVKEGANYPATHVSWEDAVNFCRKLSNREGKNYRLPTEAEWEYACRAGTTSAYSFGDDPNKLSEYGWWGGLTEDGNAKNEQYAHEVAAKQPNGYGLYDMHGNAWEWCSDIYGDYRSGAMSDPRGLASGVTRVHRGGGWNYIAACCRSAERDKWPFDQTFVGLGFRVALER